MSVLPPASSPRAALRDLMAVVRRRSPEQVLAATLSVLITAIILIIFLVDSQINTAPPPTVIYVEDYKPGRTEAEIKADQAKDAAVRHAYAKEKQEQFKRLEKKFHIE